jgi:SAM-dependent methyltransferase
MHTNSKLLFEKYAKEYFRPGMHILEIGPDRFPSTFRSLVADNSATWDTLDLYQHAQLTYTAVSEYDFPIPESKYDIVLSGQVIEHVRKIWIWMKEVSRVCKVGGLVITINPVSWPYHEAPIDCWRAFPEGMRALYEDASLKVILSKWESLEASHFRRRVPGRSPEFQSRRLRVAYRMLNLLGFPAECSFDTITIGEKIDRPNPYEGVYAAARPCNGKKLLSVSQVPQLPFWEPFLGRTPVVKALQPTPSSVCSSVAPLPGAAERQR